jgi:flagellum-specific peptidoglycan hydrolase FlgJ
MEPLDFAALKRRDRAITDAHRPACEAILAHCRPDTGAAWNMTPAQWVAEFVCCAVEVLRPARIPLSPSMGQGLLESGWGRSTVLFGIKARKQDVDAGKAVQRMTKEYLDGHWVNVPAFFFMDTTMRGQFEQYLDLCRRVHPAFAKFYPARDEDYLAYILRPGKAYATDPAYTSKVQGVIKGSGLEIFDRFEMYGAK